MTEKTSENGNRIGIENGIETENEPDEEAKREPTDGNHVAASTERRVEPPDRGTVSPVDAS